MSLKQALKGFNRVLALFLAMVMLLGTAPWDEVARSIAVNVGGTTTVTGIKFVKVHNGYENLSSYIEIRGTDLVGAQILFGNIDTGYEEFGQKTISTETFLKYVFTTQQSEKLNGKVIIGSKELTVSLSNFPILTGASSKTYNLDSPPVGGFELYGNNLNNITSGAGVVAEYGRAITQTFTNPEGTSNKVILPTLTPVNGLGYQNIRISRTATAPEAADVTTIVAYEYGNAFRLVQNVGLTNLEMYPNTGAKGDYVYLNGDNFNDQKDYQVYFQKVGDTTADFNSDNKASKVSLQMNIDGTVKDRLTVKVPTSVTFQEGVNYHVIVTVVQNNEVIAEQYVKKGAVNEEFKVIQAGYRATIDQVSPEFGPDTGSDVVITGKNLLTVDLPGLVGTGAINTIVGSNSDKLLTINYANGTYEGENVTISRKIATVIGKETVFSKSGTNFDYIKGDTNSVPDRFTVKTQGIDDVATDPQKDVVVEIETTITNIADPTKVYVFNQVATRINAYTFLASSVDPEITSITPSKIHVEASGTGYKLKNETQIVIKGKNFAVYKKVNPDGSVELKKPSVFFKGVNNISETQYQIAILPNKGTGEIAYKANDGDLPVDTTTLLNKLQMTVLNDNNQVVDGTQGNEIGTKIIFRVPSEVGMRIVNVKKNLQITNPRRGSDNFGNATIKYDSVEFITTNDYPIIETVAPSVVSVDGDVEIIVRGTNFQPGVEVYLDGESISPIRREVDTAGNKINLLFKAPKGREGITQLQIINPSGGLAVWDFVYVKSFSKDPLISSFNPPRGIAGTLVSINGDNFLKPDPTAPSNIGFDANRLIGSKIFIDGKDVNEYNINALGGLNFIDYTAPLSESVIKVELGKSAFSKFYKNTYVYKNAALPADEDLYYFEIDGNYHPVITNYDEEYYVIRYNVTAGKYQAYNKEGTLLGDTTVTYAAGVTTISINNAGTPVVFSAVMDNKLLKRTKIVDGSLSATVSDYADSIILENRTIPASPVFFTLGKDYAGNIRLTNGKDKVYTITYSHTDSKFYAKPDSGAASVEVVTYDNRITVDGVSLFLTSPYKKDVNNYLYGKRTKIISKDQILVTVPELTTGTGYKNLAVVNPDTKEFVKKGTEGFYYISQSATHPIITGIDPSFGSVDGGYSVKISGVEFEDNMKVYIDSQLVPAKDTFVAIDGKSITVVVPKCMKRLKEDYGVEKMAVPVVVLNEDGGADQRPDGFTYVIPSSKPFISKIIDTKGSSNGNDIVEITGSDFRFFEPYKDTVGAPGYTPPTPTESGDVFTDINKNGVWDDYLDIQDKAITYVRTNDPSFKDEYDEYMAIKSPYTLHPMYTFYFKSKTMPRVFFGNKEAKIIEYGKGYIRVLTPDQPKGDVDVYVINNDSGISNKVKYTYDSSAPKISNIIPAIGAKTGQETKDLYGESLYKSVIRGYFNHLETSPPIANDAITIDNSEINTIRDIPDVGAIVRFANIDNRKIDRNQPNSGLINNGRATVVLTGGLTMEYISNNDGSVSVRATMKENGKIYTRTFENYDNTAVFIPLEMLKAADGDFYAPTGFVRTDSKLYTNNVFEYVRVSIEDRRLMVERGYAPHVIYDNESHVIVTTPSYYSIDTVDVTYYNPDGGTAKVTFEYTNPASQPRIYDIKPSKISDDSLFRYIEGSVKGLWEIEIRGEDFREGVKVSVNGKQAEIVEITKVKLPNAENPAAGEKEYDNLIVKIPPGADTDIDKKLIVFIENKDRGLANSGTIANLIGPNKDKPIYIIYKKPLSLPKISKVTPSQTSSAGNRTLVITGTDFRSGLTVTLGSKNGVPLNIVSIDPRGTSIVVTTPVSLTLGDKAVTVTNSDFGSDTLDNAIKIISNPILFGQFFTEDGKAIVTTVSLEGGDTILLKGKNFDKSSKVFFGGTYTKETAATPTGEYGLNAIDEWWKVENGAAATTVEYIDAQTLKVKTPERLTEGKIIVTVINGDKGITDGTASLIYKVPTPTAPTNLKAEVVSGQYIRLYEYTSKNVDYYEVYFYIGTKTESQLKVGQYKDFQYLSNTNTEPYKVTRLPGYDKLKDKQQVYFVIKAVNKFGPSNYSNIAVIVYEDLKDVPTIGAKDYDGAIGVPDGKTHTHTAKGNQSVTNLSSKLTVDTLKIEIPTEQSRALIVRFVNVPEVIVKEGRTTVVVNYGDSVVQFLPVALNTEPFRQMAFSNSAYGRLVTKPINDNFSQAMKSEIPRTFKAVSSVYTIEPYAVNNQTAVRSNTFNGSIDFGVSYNGEGMTAAQENSIKLYYYDSNSNNWVAITSRVDTARNTVSARITKAGQYILLMKK